MLQSKKLYIVIRKNSWWRRLSTASPLHLPLRTALQMKNINNIHSVFIFKEIHSYICVHYCISHKLCAMTSAFFAFSHYVYYSAYNPTMVTAHIFLSNQSPGFRCTVFPTISTKYTLIDNHGKSRMDSLL